MKRREFFRFSAGMGAALLAPPGFAKDHPGYQNLLILIELKGGNDGLNTVVPYTDPAYYRLRPQIAIRREEVLQLDQSVGLHPGLQPLMALWQSREMAVIQGIGYPQPNLSHFRSIEIWDTASRSEQFLQQGWLARAFAVSPTPEFYSADGVVIGSQEMGPLSGNTRVVALANTDQFLKTARLAMPARVHGNPALEHLLKVESDIVKAADGLRTTQGKFDFKTEFPKGGFGDVVKTAAQVIAAGEHSGKKVAVLRLTLGSFDTHQNQPATQAALLKQLAEGINALKSSLRELDRWDSTVLMTYSEFGRRPAENLSKGTDHGTVSPHFVMGGRVKGGLFGSAPDLAQLDGAGNLLFQVDFRNLYATVLEQWWGVNSRQVLGEQFRTLDLLRT